MKRLLAGAAFFALGGAAAAVLPLTGRTNPAMAAASASALPPGRIAVSPAQLKEAYAARLIDRPIKSVRR